MKNVMINVKQIAYLIICLHSYSLAKRYDRVLKAVKGIYVFVLTGKCTNVFFSDVC